MFLKQWTSRLGAIAGVSHLPCISRGGQTLQNCGNQVLEGCQNKLSPTTREHWG
jgi:hypothetical protein